MVPGLMVADMTAVRVLIVDDVPQVREELRTLLTLAGAADAGRPIEVVGEAANGLEAVHLAEALQPEVVLMDLEMPLLDGYQAACRIKARYPSCRVIALSIHGGQAEQHRAAQAGVDVFIVKGAPLDRLVQAILVGKE